jgi:nondiscriminating aspartyl-tRNA synthetase
MPQQEQTELTPGGGAFRRGTLWSSQVADRVGERVRVAGWLHHQRQLSGRTFLVVRDGRGTLQVVIEEPSLIEAVAELLPETVIEVEGLVVAMAQAPGGVELHEPQVEVISRPAEAPPIELKRKTLKEQLPTILDHAPVAHRHPRQQAIFRLQAATLAGFRRALSAEGFIEIQTPKLVGGATETGATVFEVGYFGQTAYLAQSPQLYKQMMVGVFERVFETGPVFRAEPSETARHLAEYVSLDAEVGFISSHRDVMAFARTAVAGMAEAVGREERAIELLGVTVPVVPEEIPIIHFHEAQGLIERETGRPTVGEPDLAPADERFLGEWALREHGSEFLFVEGYPMIKRPFYTHPEPGREEFSASFDLIFRGLELITGGQRLHRYEDYLAALEARGMAPEPLDGYLQAFKYGMPPHGGFAIGLERWVARLTEAQNIRETTLFPRDRNRLSP